jgi:hypothetical protein
MSENEENPLQQATTTEENVLEEFINVNNSFVPAAYRVNCIITYSFFFFLILLVGDSENKARESFGESLFGFSSFCSRPVRK